MPVPAEILSNLSAIATGGLALAVLWHVAAAVAIAVVVAGWRPTARTAGRLIPLAAASVSVLAFVYGNPFNGAVFGLLTVLLLAVGTRLDTAPVHAGTRHAAWIGGALVAYALVYPHFLAPGTTALYLVAAPVGLVPCPTLALMVGCTLLIDGRLSEAWSTTLFTFAIFYALVGMLRLGVWLDVGLLAGAVALVVGHRGSPDERDAFPIRIRRA